MPECILRDRLDFHRKRPIEVVYDAPETSSDAGVLLLRQVDERLELTAKLGEFVPDDRDTYAAHKSGAGQAAHLSDRAGL